MDLRQQWRSLITHQRQVSLIVVLSLPVLIISVALVLNSLPASFASYQTYQDAVHTLGTLESQFNQEVLKSRYELFTSYDPIVQNIANQKRLQTQLEQTIPHFFGQHEQQDIQRILSERRTALDQKEDLSELFKTQNAQLKNSLRYLPFLTERLEDSFNTTALVFSASAQSPPAPSNSAPQPPASDVPSRFSEELVQLKNILNQLIRNVLLYNASADEELATNTETLVQQLTDLENTLELDSDLIPIDLFRRHAQIILTTKRYVEDYTEQLLLPLNQHADDIEAMLERAYQHANDRVNQYRFFTVVWVFALLGLGNVVALQYFRQNNPVFSYYRQQVKSLANVATSLQQVQSALSLPFQHQTSPQQPKAAQDHDAQTAPPHHKQVLTPFLQRRDELGWLAQSLQQWNTSIQQNHQMEQEESFSFLTARLSCLTQNRRRFMTPQACAVVRTTVERVLAVYRCELLDVQFESDQMLILFSYPATVQLASLIKTVKTQTAVDLYAKVKTSDPTMQGPGDIWAGAYLIASCEPPSQPSRKAFADQVSKMTMKTSPSAAAAVFSPSPIARSPVHPQTTIQTMPPTPVPSSANTIRTVSPSPAPPTTIQTMPPSSSPPAPPTTIQTVSPSPAPPTTIQTMPDQADDKDQYHQ
ncbi:MAG: hypothetical protein F6K30_15055 [Cyanothece sp. SIO2G6]|nr:hypothetical protein [Cyanothece sp. SIO2G6]